MSSRDFEEPREERTEDARRRSGELLEERDGGKPAAPLWRLFREASCGGGACRDVVEKHVISRLNQTDVKFLYDVNGETRELIKRATRSGMKLAEKFKIEEMSSISALEFAWENRSLWPSEWDETDFCKKVALTNKLELLQWIREEKKCEWDEKTIAVAARQGNLEMVKYCVANQCPIDAWACANAAKGHLECLKYLHEEAKAPWDCETASFAARNGHLHILEYFVEREYDEFDESACSWAAEYGYLECLKYLHEVAEAPWDCETANWAASNGHLHILEYLVEREYDEFNESACSCAAYNGHLNCLKYLHEEVKAPWDCETASFAAANGHLHIFEYLVEREYDKYTELACSCAAEKGHLECLKYLHEVAKAPWDCEAVQMAREYNHSECLQYLLDNDCPLPDGWRYESGTLHVPQQDA